MPNTPIFGWPYQALTDAPDGAALGEDLALAIESSLADLFEQSQWQSWTPTWTNLTVGNGTLIALYRELSEKVDFWLRLLLGGTSSVGSAPTFTLPVAPSSNVTDLRFTGYARDVGTNTHVLRGRIVGGGSTLALEALTVSGSAVVETPVSATVPFTWVSTDHFGLFGSYIPA